MSFIILAALLLLVSHPHESKWPLDTLAGIFTVRGEPREIDGAVGKGISFDGAALLELNDSVNLSDEAFTVSLWFNPHDLTAGQQMIAGKNRYSQNQREWSLTIEPNGKLKAFLYQNGWATITCHEPLVAGNWYSLHLAVEAAKASFYLNGEKVGEVTLNFPILKANAPITLGGIWDRDTVIQGFHGAIDNFAIHPHALKPESIAASYRPVATTHELPKPVQPKVLWTEEKSIPASDTIIHALEGVQFSVIKPYEFQKDGYRFLHGVALCFHKGRLYASFGHNRGGENTDSEEARFCVSDDAGTTWSEVRTIDSGEGDVGVSHGSFLSHNGTLWAFQGAYTGIMKNVHTRAYVLDEEDQQWHPKGIVIEDGFWPMQEPQPMDDGNWIMAGLQVGGTNPAAVAISHGDNFLQWDVISIPTLKHVGMWGESTVIVDGKRITSISRFGDQAKALLATSDDYGRTWSKMQVSNLPMATSKPIAGMLSNGQRYLICTTTADSDKRRSPLTIAVSKPGETCFSEVFVIRHAIFPNGPGESHPTAALSYPYAVQHDGKLYVGYSNSGDKSTRVGTGRELWNNNSAELAVIPIEQLQTPGNSQP